MLPSRIVHRQRRRYCGGRHCGVEHESFNDALIEQLLAGAIFVPPSVRGRAGL